MKKAKKKTFSISRKKSKFKVSNWREYNDTLRKRGRIDFMIAENLSEGWYEDDIGDKKRGGQKIYSDRAILLCLEIRYLFRLKLRQCQGFINWIFRQAGLLLTCPDYTTLSKRGKKMDRKKLLYSKDKNFEYICIDSTGIQTYTGNEWLENKHGKQYTRRTWKKLHIAIGDNGIISNASTTCHHKDDRTQVQTLLKGINAKEVLGDLGYDSENIYQILREKGIKPIIKPPNHYLINKVKTERQQNVAYQQAKGYHAWRNKNRYGRRELVENSFFRFKGAFGSQFLSRNNDNMQNEMLIKCQLLNKMFEIGKPVSILVT